MFRPLVQKFHMEHLSIFPFFIAAILTQAKHINLKGKMQHSVIMQPGLSGKEKDTPFPSPLRVNPNGLSVTWTGKHPIRAHLFESL